MRPARSLAILALVLAATGCATRRAPLRAPVAEPLPLAVGVCPGPFGDFGGEGRDLLRAVRERRLFREVHAVTSDPAEAGRRPALDRRLDLLLVPQVEALPARSASRLGMATLVPWVATATVFPWLVDRAQQVGVQVLAGGDCRAARGGTLTVRDAERLVTQAMIGWTAPVLPLVSRRWERGSTNEFRPAVDSLVARRAELLRLVGAGGG